jgi:glucuronosyltransferase
VAVLVLLASLQGYKGAKILGLFPIAAPSHAAVSFAIVKELAQRGHQVTVLSPYPQEKPIPNYTDIAVHKTELEDLLNITTGE